jgi:hypothetical protein
VFKNVTFLACHFFFFQNVPSQLLKQEKRVVVVFYQQQTHSNFLFEQEVSYDTNFAEKRACFFFLWQYKIAFSFFFTNVQLGQHL